jgi:prepilin peptidase CpaA
MSEPLSILLLAVLALLLVAACLFDLKARIIPHSLNAAIALLAIPFWWSSGLGLWPDVALQVGIALALFTLFTFAQLIGAMGGGDVKMIGALALWLPWQAIAPFLFVMSLAGGAITLAMLAARRLRRGGERIEVPYGIAIACGGLWLISERFLYQFG